MPRLQFMPRSAGLQLGSQPVKLHRLSGTFQAQPTTIGCRCAWRDCAEQAVSTAFPPYL